MLPKCAKTSQLRSISPGPHVTETWEPAPNTGHTEPVRAGQCKTSRVFGVGGIEFELDNTADDGNGNGIRAGINDCACKRDHGSSERNPRRLWSMVYIAPPSSRYPRRTQRRRESTRATPVPDENTCDWLVELRRCLSRVRIFANLVLTWLGWEFRRGAQGRRDVLPDGLWDLVARVPRKAKSEKRPRCGRRSPLKSLIRSFVTGR